MQKNLLKTLVFTVSTFFLATLSLQAEITTYLPYDSHLATDLYQGFNLLVLEDGSEWKVSDYDQGELYSWYANDPVVPITITPNYFSTLYTYYLTHEGTGSYVRANLVGAPVRQSPYAVTIIGLNQSFFGRGDIYLSNGTFWRVSAIDLDSMRNWYIDDLIIIGKNTEWFSFNTHILINIHTNTFVRAQRI